MKLTTVADRLFQSFLANEEREALPGVNYEKFASYIQHFREELRARTSKHQCIALTNKKTTATYAMWLACWLEGRSVVFLSSSQGEEAQKSILATVQPALVFNDEPLKESNTSLQKPAEIKTSDIAYYIATSGSSGLPKIIKVSHASLSAWIENSSSSWDIQQTDRVSQIFDLAFDPSISDVLWTFLSGACLIPLDLRGMLDIGSWVQKNQVTVWSSSPSQGKSLVLSVNANKDFFQSVRRSTFIGETLTRKFVEEWRSLLSQSLIENHYGPAECVISVSRKIIKPEDMSEEILSIGSPYPGVHFLLNDSGNLVIRSSQVASGYLNSNNTNFSDGLYNTGDLALQNNDGLWKILGRTDSQIKINGQRWESEGIEACFEKHLKGAVCIKKWIEPEHEGIDIVLFGSPSPSLPEDLENVFRHLLPNSLRPRTIWLRSEIPLNSSGKMNRILVQNEVDQGLLNAYEF